MNKSYKKRFQMFSESLSDPELVNYARKNGNNTFSRKRKMPLKDMLLCCLSKKGLTTAFELRNYFKDKGEFSMQLSVQGYLQQRKRLNPEIFPYLNRKYLMDFYHSDEPRLWKGYLLIAIDGSKAEVPNSKENRETFGNSGNQHPKTGQVRALISGMYDVLNHFYLDIEMEHISVSENELAKRNIKHLKEMEIRQPVLAIFDRGYPSIEFIDFLETEGIHYLIRLSSNDYKEGLPIADVERLHENKCLFGIEMSDKSEFLLKIGKRDAEQEAYLMELDETDSKIHEIYERYTNSWEYNDALMHNDFDIDWLQGKLDIENYRKLEDYILYYCSRNDEPLFQLGFKYAWSLFHECAEKEKIE